MWEKGSHDASWKEGEFMKDKKKREGHKSKALDLLETLFYTVMSVGILGILAAGTICALGVVGAAVAFGILTAVCVLLFISIKRDDQQKKEYAERYISEIILEDEAFGTMRFEEDSAEHRLICRGMAVPFGKYYPIIRLEGQGWDKEIFFRNLEYVYGRQADIIENLLELLLDDDCSSREELEKRFTVECIRMQKYHKYLAGEDPLAGSPEDWIISVEGNAGIENEPLAPAAYVNCSTREIDYVLAE